MTNTLPSCFITLEGGEGAGKSSLLHTLASQLRQEGHEVLITREPGGTALGEEIRSMVLSAKTQCRIDSTAELLLFLAGRAQHLDELIIPALKRGAIVICDRFNDSTIAYQGAGRQLGVDFVSSLCQLACRGREPHLTLLLDVPIEIGLERTRHTSKDQAAAGELDRIEAEQTQFHSNVRDAFLKLAEQNPQRIVILDATLSKEQVAQQALDAISHYVRHADR